jgi:hypothetical protein
MKLLRYLYLLGVSKLKQLPLLALPITITFIKLLGRAVTIRRNEIDKASKRLSGWVACCLVFASIICLLVAVLLDTLMDLRVAREQADMLALICNPKWCNVSKFHFELVFLIKILHISFIAFLDFVIKYFFVINPLLILLYI